MTSMEEARKAIDEFLARSGHHDTTVTETVAPVRLPGYAWKLC